jgi:hypothetical protein
MVDENALNDFRPTEDGGSEPCVPWPSQADQFICELKKVAESSSLGAAVPVTFRLHLVSLAFVDAYVQFSGSSRNKILNQIFDIGLEAIRKSPLMTDQLYDSINTIAGQIVSERSNGSDVETISE